MFVHKYDKRNAASIGSKSERLFIGLASKRGFEVKHSSPQQNKIQKIDFYLTKNDVTKGFDVKARKKLSASHQNYNDDWMWVEFKNADGFKGWLYGEADYIAFEKKDYYLIVDRISLLNFSLKAVDFSKEFARFSEDAKYRLYNRRDSEEIALVKTSDVKKINRTAIWNKNYGL